MYKVEYSPSREGDKIKGFGDGENQKLEKKKKKFRRFNTFSTVEPPSNGPATNGISLITYKFMVPSSEFLLFPELAKTEGRGVIKSKATQFYTLCNEVP